MKNIGLILLVFSLSTVTSNPVQNLEKGGPVKGLPAIPAIMPGKGSPGIIPLAGKIRSCESVRHLIFIIFHHYLPLSTIDQSWCFGMNPDHQDSSRRDQNWPMVVGRTLLQKETRCGQTTSKSGSKKGKFQIWGSSVFPIYSDFFEMWMRNR